MRVKLKTLGCRLNEAELEAWARQFAHAGHRIVTEDETCDLVVFNSCAVTGDAARKSRNLVRREKRHNPTARVVLSGCYASLNQTGAAALDVDLVVTNPDKHRLVELVQERFNLPAEPPNPLDPVESALFRRGRQRAFIKVQDGCRYRCTYCIVTVARGEERSRPVEDIVAEVNAIQAEGIREIVLTGVHLGGYGSDLSLRLDHLLEALLEQTDIPRIRLGSLEPWDIPEPLIRLFDNPRLMPHLHLPLQSGSDTVLRRMARRCRTDEFSRLADTLRTAIPDINLTTDLIVGFPGETEAEWQQTLDYVEKTGFGHIHVFGYSPRAGTPAAGLPNPVPVAVIQQRSQMLRQLAEQQALHFRHRFLGRVFPVLWEKARTRPDGSQENTGLTPNYLRVALPFGGDADKLNQITPTCLTRLLEAFENGDFEGSTLRESGIT